MSQIKTIAPMPGPVKRFALVLCGAVIMAINLNTFVHTGGLFPGGFTGVTLLVQEVFLKYARITVPYTLIYLLLNAFPVYISFKHIGKKFTLYSLLMIVIASILTDVIPGFTVTDDVLLCAIFGGLINAVAICLCLFADATSGGTDFIAIYFSEKYGRDMWNYIFIGNCVVLAAAGFLFGWDKALYSIIFQFTSTQVLNLLYKRYQKETLLIITDKPDELYKVIHDETNHDATRFTGTGCYKNSSKTMLYTVISGEEVQSVTKSLRKADPSAFINVLETKEILGKFFRRPND